MSNAKRGSETERRICEMLSSKGWWVHRFQRNDGGQQPCDIVAMRKSHNLLIDAKHCEKPYLATYRIEANQRTCFDMASDKGIECLFVCEYKGEFYSLRWSEIDFNRSIQRLSRRFEDEIACIK